MAAEAPFDIVEQILLGLDVKDILRCKSVCKYWRSFISSPDFVEAYLKHSGGHRRISISVDKDPSLYVSSSMFIAGSCNGLVCVSPKGAEFEVVNPCTREIKKLPTPLFQPDEKLERIRQVLTVGFGYDASTDDYKVIVGFRKGVFVKRTEFYVLALKSNVWRSIGQVNYRGCFRSYAAIFCGGALHWLMYAARKKVIMSVNLSTEECNEIPQPLDADYDCGDTPNHVLGVIEECLCIYSLESSKIWVNKNNKWQLYNNYNECKYKYDVAHCLTRLRVVDSQLRTSYVYAIDDGRLVQRSSLSHIRASMFVKSLVSPHPPKGRLEGNNDAAKGNITKKKKRKKKRSCKH